MPTIQPVRPEEVSGPTRRLLDALAKEYGRLSNLLMTMANAPGILEAYLDFNRELEEGSLGGALAVKIALTVAEVEQSEYALAQHAARARVFGMNDEEILSIREGRVPDTKTASALQFARAMCRRTGEYPVAGLRDAGYTDDEIVSMIACVGISSLINLFHAVVKTELDFPNVTAATKAA